METLCKHSPIPVNVMLPAGSNLTIANIIDAGAKRISCVPNSLLSSLSQLAIFTYIIFYTSSQPNRIIEKSEFEKYKKKGEVKLAKLEDSSKNRPSSWTAALLQDLTTTVITPKY